MREMCRLSRAKGFDHFRDVMSEKSIMQLKNLYRSANDVDLPVGGGLEDRCVDKDDSGLVGPTFGCIIAEQFFRWRSGDRYFFHHAQGPGYFTKAQLKAIMKVTLSSLLCENLEDLEYMQADAFSIISKKNPLQHCKHIPKLDLGPWKAHRPKRNRCPLNNKKGHGENGKMARQEEAR
ncbi:peroxidase-like [Hetaerina americana]|uniref:peroxidase-like n=1 Tax=Hetaerina americana TaxID=62018 RepID=UPI003A7F2A10